MYKIRCRKLLWFFTTLKDYKPISKDSLRLLPSTKQKTTLSNFSGLIPGCLPRTSSTNLFGCRLWHWLLMAERSLKETVGQVLQFSGPQFPYVRREYLTRGALRLLPELLTFGADWRLSHCGNLESVPQPCVQYVRCGVHWGDRGSGLLCPSLVLIEKKELGSKKSESSTWSNVLSSRVSRAPSQILPDAFILWKVLEKCLMGFIFPGPMRELCQGC